MTPDPAQPSGERCEATALGGCAVHMISFVARPGSTASLLPDASGAAYQRRLQKTGPRMPVDAAASPHRAAPRGLAASCCRMRAQKQARVLGRAAWSKWGRLSFAAGREAAGIDDTSLNRMAWEGEDQGTWSPEVPETRCLATGCTAGQNGMDSPPGVPESAGALDSMDGDGPSAPSGHGPQSPVDYATDASVSSLSTHGLPPAEFVPAPEARPAPWPQSVASPRPVESRSHKPANDGATNKILFNYPETPGRGAVRGHSG